MGGNLGGNGGGHVNIGVLVFSVHNVVTDFNTEAVGEVALGTDGWVHEEPVTIDGETGNHDSLFVEEVLGGSNSLGAA